MSGAGSARANSIVVDYELPASVAGETAPPSVAANNTHEPGGLFPYPLPSPGGRGGVGVRPDGRTVHGQGMPHEALFGSVALTVARDEFGSVGGTESHSSGGLKINIQNQYLVR
jgi:hypothetical protein